LDLSQYYLNPIALCSFLTVLYLVLLASWGLSLNPRARTNQAFVFMSLHALVWQLGIGFMLCSRDPALAERWYRFSYLGVVFICPGVFLFTSSVSQQLARNRARILAAYSVAFLFGLEGVLGNSTITGVWEYPWGFYPRYGPWSAAFLGLFALLMVVIFKTLLRGLRTVQSGFQKKQIKALIAAFSIAYLAASDFVPCFGIPIYPVGFAAVVFFVTMMFWSIYRYQLLNPSPESLARNVLATIADSIIVLDADGFVRMVNPKAEELLGYTKKDLLQKHFSCFVDPPNAEVARGLVRTLRRSQRAVESGVVSLLDREGKPVPTSCNVSAIRDWKGKALGFVLACRDLQDIARSKEIIQEQGEKIQETQERYGALFNRSLVCVYVYDFEGNFLDANQAALDLLGYTREDLPALDFASVLSEEQLPKAIENAGEIIRTGRQDSFASWRLRRKDGTFVWVETEASLIYRRGKPYAIQGILRDVTERKQAEEELKRHHECLKELVEERTDELKQANQKLEREITERIQIEERLRKLNEELDRRVTERTADLEKANEELTELDRMKDSFLSSVSHELRTPLTSIRSFSEILLNHDQEDLDTQKEFLGIINSESERLTRLINDVLDLSRIEEGGRVWNDAVVSLEEIIHDILPAHQRLLEEKSLRVTLDLSPDLPPVFVDRDRIQQVVRNLLANAIKFSHEGGKIVVKMDTFEGRRTGKSSAWIKVSLSDQGIGIDERDFEIVFDRFRQVSSDTLKDKPQGTGLGLPICRDIVSHYKGNIWIESRKGEGSTFSFTLPAATADAERGSEDLPAGELPAPNGNGKTILVVEENLNTRRVLRSQLERKGFTVLEASDADEALAVARKQRIDLILLDLLMPKLGEDDLLGVFKEDPATENVPVLIISVVESTESGILPGAHGFLRKPFREEELIFKVQTLLEDRNRSILVADDNPGVRNSLQMQLEDLGYPVYLAENGEEAMELLKLSVPDLLILDVVMPDKGGQEVLSWIRNNKDTRDLPVIILTGYPLLGELDRLRALGIEACMEKSKDLSPLFSKIDSIFEAPAR
jgi:PAS domain S-box-containing protein